MFVRLSNATSSSHMTGTANETGVNTTAVYVIRHWNTTGHPRWARILRVNGILTEEFLEDDSFDLDGVIYPVKKDGLVPMILVLPLGGMLLFLSLIALVVLFRRHPAIVMAVTASSLLAAGAYNLGLVLWTSEESAYRTTFDPRAPPKYE
ncbi:uncharacterized protein LOC124159639 isoform X2 [Ischnura elegans]|uniref:uncharacterized protein LOC124159639 isoform X2 n=1 Tax=Ischnura elegans TaxID=197161 RepID=UPI001ED8B4EB|nr:uncharacterized protein LOC124159639 isoform X2 [Ischnura elegans]